MKITFLGHSCLQVESQGKKVIIDPFLTGNGTAAMKASDVEVDAILLTHAHADHLGDAIDIAKRTGAPIIAVFELAAYCAAKGAKIHPMHIGGSYNFDFGRVKFTLAFHGAAIEEDGKMIYGGNPAGILLTMNDKTLFHAGDTGLFGDMKIIGELNRIDMAALPIGDNFTMGPDDALIAATWLQAKKVMPIHYNTFPLINQNPQEFAARLQPLGIEGLPLAPGESVEL